MQKNQHQFEEKIQESKKNLELTLKKFDESMKQSEQQHKFQLDQNNKQFEENKLKSQQQFNEKMKDKELDFKRISEKEEREYNKDMKKMENEQQLKMMERQIELEKIKALAATQPQLLLKAFNNPSKNQFNNDNSMKTPCNDNDRVPQYNDYRYNAPYGGPQYNDYCGNYSYRGPQYNDYRNYDNYRGPQYNDYRGNYPPAAPQYNDFRGYDNNRGPQYNDYRSYDNYRAQPQFYTNQPIIPPSNQNEAQMQSPPNYVKKENMNGGQMIVQQPLTNIY